MNIMIVFDSLSSGGVSRVASDISRCWVERGHDVTMVTDFNGHMDFYRLDPRVKRMVLGQQSARKSRFRVFRRIRTYRRAIKRVAPHVIVSLNWSCGFLIGLAALRMPCRMVTCEYLVPAKVEMSHWRKWFRRKSNFLADAVTSESAEVRDWVQKNTMARRSVVIPKSVRWPLVAEDPEVLPDSVCKSGRKIILAAGRLVPVKDFKSLIHVFALVAAERENWDLAILGEGPCRSELSSETSRLGLENRVLLPGRVGNLEAWYQRASIFSVSSLHEGGPNVLIEALSYGLPAVSFNCEAGPKTIIRENIDGFLIEPGDEAAFGSCLARLMDDEELLARMSARAVEARTRFSEEQSMKEWDALFRTIGCEKQKRLSR